MALYQVPTQNNLQYTLDVKYTSGGTTLTLNTSVTSTVQAPGVCVVDRIDSSGNKTATKRTYYSFTGVSGADLTGLAVVDGTDQDHAVGAIVEFVPDVDTFQSYYDTFTTEHATDGTHGSATVTTLKATGAEIDTGTNDTKIVTPKAIADATVLAKLAGTQTFSGAKSFSTAPKMDTISEKTAGAGVTVDGLKIKDGVGVYTDKAPNINVKARAHQSTQQTNLTDAAVTVVTLDAEDYDIGSDFAANTFTAPVTGYYQISGAITYINVIADSRYDCLVFVGAGLKSFSVNHTGSDVAADKANLTVRVNDVLYLTSTQTVSMKARIFCGANTVDILNDSVGTYLAIHLLST